MQIKSIVMFLVVFCFLAMLGMLYWQFQGEASTSQKAKGVTPVVVEKVMLQDVSNSVEALGTAFANESVDITSNETETISKILFEDGQFVHQGDVLVILEQQEELAQLKAAEAQLQEHRREYIRLKNLLKNNAASKRMYDERKTLIEVTEQQVEEIKARIAERSLKAPFDGVLGLRRLSQGALVQPGTVITTLDDIDVIKLDFTVPDIHLHQLHAGIPIEASSISLGDRLFKGHISHVDTRVNPVTRSVVVRAILPNENRLIKPGILMQVTMLKAKRQALTVPEEAVFQKQDKHFVYVVEKSQASAAEKIVRQQQVGIGIRRPGFVEILSGLDTGDMVVTRGIHQLRDGEAITIQDPFQARKNAEIENIEGI